MIPELSEGDALLDALSADDEFELIGRFSVASNATFLGRIAEQQVVYKPIAGERALWDFPDVVLADREYAAWLLSDFLGWHIVPATVLRDGPHGPGMVQAWWEHETAGCPVQVVKQGEIPAGWLHILDGTDAEDRPVSLVHADEAALRQIAVFDVLCNNADRKGGHLLRGADGTLRGVDHGLTFHIEPKLRTVLWGWIGAPLTDDEITGVAKVRNALSTSESELVISLARHLGEPELAALRRRCEGLLAAGTFPAPSGHAPAIPWPPF